jgi:hypothetical protein
MFKDETFVVEMIILIYLQSMLFGPTALRLTGIDGCALAVVIRKCTAAKEPCAL